MFRRALTVPASLAPIAGGADFRERKCPAAPLDVAMARSAEQDVTIGDMTP